MQVIARSLLISKCYAESGMPYSDILFRSSGHFESFSHVSYNHNAKLTILIIPAKYMLKKMIQINYLVNPRGLTDLADRTDETDLDVSG